jgi:uncharacterized phage infection (PIP) family protein YhgE
MFDFQTVTGSLSAIFQWIVCSAIVLVAAVGAWRYLWPLWQVTRALEHATRGLGSGTTEVAAPFPARPQHLNALWAEYRRLRERSTVQCEGESVCTADPEDVFTEPAVLGGGYNRGLALTLPGVFTGLGILGTFMGLVAGLSGIPLNNPNGISEGAGQLIGGMATAFNTSLAGILLSLIWLFAHRRSLRRLHEASGKFFDAVRKRYRVEDADALLQRLLSAGREGVAATREGTTILAGHTPLFQDQASDLRQLRETAAAQRESMEDQKAILQNLGSDLATAFQDKLDESLGRTLAPALETIAQTLRDHTDRARDNQAESLRQMVEAFQARLSDQLGGQFEGLAKTLESAGEWQTRVHGQLDTLVDRMQQTSEVQLQVLERSTAACDLFSSSIGELGEMHQRLQETSRKVEAGTGALLAQFHGIAQNVERVAAELDACVNSVAEQTSALADRIAILDAQQETYRQANEAIQVQLARQLDSVSSQVDELTGFWNSHRQELDALGEKLRSSVHEFGTFTAEKLGEVFQRFDGEMAKVVEHLSGTLAEVREVTEDLPGAVERLREGLQGSTGAITAASGMLGELSRNLRTLDALPAAVGALAPLPGAVAQATEQVRSTGASLSSLDAHLSSVEGRLDGFLVLLEHRAGQGNGSGNGAKVAVPEIVGGPVS